MSNSSPAPVHADPHSVSTLLNFHDLHRHSWETPELGEMLRHQLNAPLQMGLGTLSAEVSHQLRASSDLSPLLTLGQLLAHPQPPLELLKLVKRFAKTCKSDVHNPLPPKLVMLLYYVSIAAALVRLGQRISELPDPQLRRGLRWLAAQAWVTPEIQTLLTEAMNQIPLSTGEAAPTEPEPLAEPIME